VKFTPEELLRHYDQKPNIPFQLARNLDFSTLSKFAEQSVTVPGVQETARPTRRYNFGALGGHILGFVGDIEEQVEGVYIETVGKQGWRGRLMNICKAPREEKSCARITSDTS
jgi:cell division protein FtsI/penicillin-binding protein 2